MGKTKYWKGLEELNNSPEFVQKANNEFAEQIPVEDFLYAAILLCMNISLYEWRKNKQQIKRSI